MPRDNDTVFWQWATVVGLSMTPALIAGQSAAAAAAIGFGFGSCESVAVIAVSSFVQGLILLRLAEISERWPRLHRWLERLRTPRAVAFAEKWGPWGGMTLGVAVVGPEPILIALKWMKIETARILLPLALSSFGFATLYYVIVAFGLDQASGLDFDHLFPL